MSWIAWLVNIMMFIGFLSSFGRFIDNSEEIRRLYNLKLVYIGMKVVYLIACITFLGFLIWFNWWIV